MTKLGIERCKQQVFIGEKRLPVRLVIGLVPPQVYEERVHHKQAKEKRKGNKMKERTKDITFQLFRYHLLIRIL